MFRNYLKIAFRTLWKHKTHTGINVLGLAIAFGSATLLLLVTLFQLSFDQFHADADRIYQTYSVINSPDGIERRASMPYPFALTLKREFPELDGVTRYQEGNAAVQYGDRQLDKQIDHVDPDMLTIFSFPLRQGNPKTALNDLNSVVITENMARDVFGKIDPVGKIIRINNGGTWRNLTVTAVMADFPNNSSLQFDALTRIEGQPDYAGNKDRWDYTNHSVYLKVRPGTTPAVVDQRLRAFTATYFQQAIRDLKQQGAKPDDRGELISTRLISLSDAYFDTVTNGRATPRPAIYAIALVGLFILLIAAINFINLTLARSFGRAREVGVRKTMGARPVQVFAQLWGETIVVCGLGVVLGVGLAVALQSTLNTRFGMKLSLVSLANPTTAVVVLTLFLLVTLLAGGYPAWVMMGFGTVQALSGKIQMGRQNFLRNALIVVQFTIASLLIVSTLVVVQQTRFMRQVPLGFRQEQVISIPVGNEVRGRDALQRLRNRLSQNPNVLSVTGSGVNLGRGRDGSTTRAMVGFLHNDHEVNADWLRVDYDYLETLGIRLRAGRDFSRQYATDSTSAVVVSESFVKQLGEKQPIGATFQIDSGGVKHQIIGVIPDFHLYSLRNKVEPIVMHLHQDAGVGYIFVRVTPQSLIGMMETLRREWRQIAPKSEFMASFLDENTNTWYKQDESLADLLTLAAGIAILLSCMGLFAVALMSIQQRTKEIGVRKVLGASVSSIVTLLSNDFLKLVLIAIVIASPLAWYAMNQWLQGFAYHVDIEWWVFVLAGLLAVGIALLTVSFQSVKAALMNPVTSLRSE